MNTQKTIITANDAYLAGYDGTFLRYLDANGRECAGGINNYWYQANAIDDEGNDYIVYWEITHPEYWDDGDEGLLCDWDAPDMIVRDGKNVIDDVIVVFD